MKHLLLNIDREYLDEKAYDFSVSEIGGALHLVIKNFELSDTYNPNIADLLIIIPGGYPNSSLDMFWTFPDIRLANGSFPNATEVHEMYGGINWQRWSRHLTPGTWRPGVDSLRTYLAIIKKEIGKEN